MVETLDKQSIKTDLGLRPIDWLPIPISDFIKEFRGGAPLTPSDFRKIGFKVLPKVGVIRGGNLFIEKNKQQYCSREYADSHKSNIIDNSFTIVVLRDLVPSGPNIGLMVRINSNEIYLLAQGVYGFKVDEPIDPDFLIHLSNTEDYRKVMRNIMVGSTQVHITNGTFKQVQIPLPPTKTEQTAIATALNDADALIHQLEQLLTKKQNIKTGAMQELLKPKEGWEEKTLHELADNKKELFDDGDWIEAEHITDNGIRIIQTGNIGIGCYIEKENKKYIFEKSFYKLKCKLLIEGDLLVCRLAEPAGRACVLPNIDESKIVTSVDVTIFRPREEVANRVFLANLFSTSKWFTKVIERVGGTTHKRISRSSLGKILISIPKIDEQNRIAKILTDMDNEIQELERKLEKYKMLKQGMMQSLLTGKIRLV